MARWHVTAPSTAPDREQAEAALRALAGDTARLREVVSAAWADQGRIDVVLSNAGSGVFGAAEELSDAQIDASLATNLTWIIQGLVILIVSADILVLGMITRGRGLFRRRRAAPAPAAEGEP